MPTIVEVAVALGGGFDKGLALIFAALGEIRASVPDAERHIDALASWLATQVEGRWSIDQLVAIATQIVGLVTGKGWGPPNSGSIAGM